jgi:O-antigen/teichoic acid export membrane protein
MTSNGSESAPTAKVLAKGVAWIGVFRWSAQLLSWAAFLVVIRAISPEDYGIAGLSLALVTVVTVVCELGLGTAVIAIPRLSERQTAQLNFLAVAMAVCAAAAFFLVSPLVAAYYREEKLADVFRVLSFVFIAEGMRVVPMAILAKELKYRVTAGLDFFRAIVTSLVVLGLALTGGGYWALIIGNIAGAVLATLWVCTKHPQSFAWPRAEDLKQPLRIGRDIVVGRLAWVLYRNSDFFVAGRVLGTIQLGQYTAAWNFASLPGEKLGNVLTAATQPFFAAVQQDLDKLRHYFVRSTQMLALVLLPVLVGLLLVADLAVPLILGEQWLPSIRTLQYLLLFAALSCVVTPVSQILNVTGRTRISMLSSILALIVLPPAFALGAWAGGIEGIAITWILLFPAIMVLPLRAALKALELTFGSYCAALWSALESILVMSVAVLLIRTLSVWNGHLIIELVAATLLGGLVYVGTLWFRQRSLVLSIRNEILG